MWRMRLAKLGEPTTCPTCNHPYAYTGIKCLVTHPPDVCCHYMQTCGTCGIGVGPAIACQRCFKVAEHARSRYTPAMKSEASYRG